MAGRGVRNGLLATGLAVVLVTFQPRFLYQGGDIKTAAEAEHVREVPAHAPYREEFSIGWHSSPLVRYATATELTVPPGGGWSVRKTGEGTLGWLSWSAATLAAGVGLIWLARRLRPRGAGEEVTGSEDRPSASSP